MQVTYKAMGGRLNVTVEGATLKEVLQQVGQVAELMDADIACGCCQSESIYPNCRVVGTYTYYSLTCSACGASLNFGQRKDGGLWAKRKGQDKKPLPNNGWSIYEPEQHASGSGPRAAATEDPKLTELLNQVRRMKLDDVEGTVLTDLFNAIGTQHGSRLSGDAWGSATRKYGDPAKTLTAALDITKFLYLTLYDGRMPQ